MTEEIIKLLDYIGNSPITKLLIAGGVVGALLAIVVIVVALVLIIRFITRD